MANDFFITVDDFTVPAATDPNKCRVFGFFRDVGGAPMRQSQIDVINKYIPQIVQDPAADLAILGERVSFKTDDTGFIEFDLFRNGEVEIFIPSQSPVPFSSPEDDPFFEVTIPDQASINIVDLLYPVPFTLEFLGTSPIVLAVDATVTEKVKLTLTDNFEATALNQITLLSSDDSLVTVVGAGTDGDGDLTIDITRVAVGQAFITSEIAVDKIAIKHQPLKQMKFIVNTVEDANGFEVN